jgi:tetratricopeptide (TPR) repeat protein
MSDPVRTLRYRDVALCDSAKAMYTWQYIAEARRWLKDDSLYVAALQEGFTRFPANTYFYPRLMDYYSSHNQYDNALAVVDKAIEANDSSLLTLYAKSNVLFNLGQLDESIGLCKRIIERNDSMPDAHYQAGICYMNKALELNPIREKKQQKKYYQCAKQYMERYRQLAPDNQDKWAPVLYRVYLNLNLGRQFDEIDRLLTKKR